MTKLAQAPKPASVARDNRSAETHAGEEVMRTPELGLEFWQHDEKNLMFATQGEKRIIRVLVKAGAF